MPFFIIFLTWTCIKESISFFLCLNSSDGATAECLWLPGMAGVGVHAQVGCVLAWAVALGPVDGLGGSETILGSHWEQEGGDC